MSAVTRSNCLHFDPRAKAHENMARMRYLISETAQYNEARPAASSAMGSADQSHCKYKRRPKKRRKRGVKKKKAINYEERDSLRAEATRKREAKERERKAALKQRLAAREKLISVVQDSVCRWTFYDRTNKVEYKCTNPRSDHPLTPEQSNYCYYHMKYCLNDHSSMHGKMLRGLDIPNRYALCGDMLPPGARWCSTRLGRSCTCQV